MSFAIAALLTLISDVIQATIVIFGAAIALYNLRLALSDRVSRAFTILLSWIVFTYFAELIALRAAFALSVEAWLRLQWLGIVMVPAAQFHLADALLNVTGAISTRRRLFVQIGYIAGLLFFGLVLFTDLVAGELVDADNAPHLQGGILFVLFALYFWLLSVVSIYDVWKARQRSVTQRTRKHMTTIALVFVAAPLSVFPYLVTGNFLSDYPIVISILVIILNLGVGVMLTLLSVRVAYFTTSTPDPLVRVRLYKFVARAPLVAAIVLIVDVLVNRTSTFLGLPVNVARETAIVATIILVEGAIHVYKQPLERLFQLTDDPDVARLQEISARVLTTRELHEFLETVLASACNLLRTPSGFIAALTDDGPHLEVVVGSLESDQMPWDEEAWQSLPLENANGDGATHESETLIHSTDEFIVWRNFWIRPLYGDKQSQMLGILGIQARAESPDLTDAEIRLFERLLRQAASALEDRLLQQEVFAALEGVLPEEAVQQRRRSALSTYSAAETLTSDEPAGNNLVLDDPDFTTMVRDALTHYWGGPKLTESPLMRLHVVQEAMEEYDGNATQALRAILTRAIEMQKPAGERSLTTAKWILYNILELKFVQGRRVRDVARNLAMSESDLYRKQRIAIENVARAVNALEQGATESPSEELS